MVAMEHTNPNLYQTRDLYFASYLLATNHNLLDVVNDETGGFFWFVFQDTGECEQLEQLFQLDDVKVKAKALTESIKYLKRRVSK